MSKNNKENEKTIDDSETKIDTDNESETQKIKISLEEYETIISDHENSSSLFELGTWFGVFSGIITIWISIYFFFVGNLAAAFPIILIGILTILFNYIYLVKEKLKYFAALSALLTGITNLIGIIGGVFILISKKSISPLEDKIEGIDYLKVEDEEKFEIEFSSINEKMEFYKEKLLKEIDDFEKTILELSHPKKEIKDKSNGLIFVFEVKDNNMSVKTKKMNSKKSK